MIDVILVAATIAIAAVTLSPRRLKSKSWRATVTPLASIIGSGFLVAGPILGHVAGRFAVLAMAGLCALAYLFGAVIRYNIAHVEPVLAKAPPRPLRLLDNASHLTLAFAYFISVAYYLNLFAAFALKGFGVIDPAMTRVIASVVIVSLGALGFFNGLKSLENVELGAVGLKLALIGGVIAALVCWAVSALASGGLEIPKVDHTTGFEEFRVLLGLVILVQGFETSRYLGAAYDGDMRVRTMRRAQLIATIVYVVFILAVTPEITGGLPQQGGETAIIDMLRPLGALLAPAIIVTAVASQISAAVADMNGSSGLIASSSAVNVNMRWGYAVTAAVALGVTWAANIFEIINYASKAFVIFYGVQSATALYHSFTQKAGGWRIRAIGIFGVFAAVVVVILGAPAEGG